MEDPSAKGHFFELQWFGYAGIYVAFDIGRSFAFSGFERGFADFPGSLEPSREQILLFALRLALFAVLLVWSAFWIIATRKELAIWLTCLDTGDEEPPSSDAIVLATALMLGLSLAFVGDALLVSASFACLAVVNIWIAVFAKHFFAVHMRSDCCAAYRKYWDFKRPYWKSRHVMRAICMFLVGSAAVVCAVRGHEAIAYFLLIACIITAEAFILIWRARRKREAHSPNVVDIETNTQQQIEHAADDASHLAWFLATLPVLSFLAQFYFSRRDGTLSLMLHHPTVTSVDWVLVLFNFFAAKVIDWSKGLAIFVIALVSTCLTLATHALWQGQGLDPGHMITKSGVVLPAGWIHIGFSIVEMILLCAFVFCRRRSSPVALVAATAYFAGMFASGYWMHHAVIWSDACVFAAGVFFLYAYPKLLAKFKPTNAATTA